MNTLIDLEPLLVRHREAHGWRELSRAISLVENSAPWDLVIPRADRRIHCVGVTGPPGAGKSTLIGRLIGAYTEAGARVGVIAVDPSSPLTGGAVLGDRLRMEQYLDRRGVFVRSMANRGSRGAIAAATHNVTRLLESSGSFDVIVIETVGAGQTEVSIASLADTVLLVTVPGLGDAVQTIKAGSVEVADIVVVNMADRPGAAETARHFKLTLGRALPVLQTVAIDGRGIDALRAVLDQRWAQLSSDGALDVRRSKAATAEAAWVAEEWARACASRAHPDLPATLRERVASILKEAYTTWHG